MDLKTLIVAIIIIILIVSISHSVTSKKVGGSNTIRSPNRATQETPILVEVERRVRHTLAMAGYKNLSWQMKNHPTSSFTQDKKHINLCTSCVTNSAPLRGQDLVTQELHKDSHALQDNNHCQSILRATLHEQHPSNDRAAARPLQSLDRLLYVGLHEVSHIINEGQDHDESWKAIFKKLLGVAANLGYLDAQRLTF